ncbi:calcium-binding protein [Mesorhizobium sp. IMUNJ 23232]|uniref:calcium-binding protein n=1 Tax=Mesorhizobium sp. IMUNJ 23232 TaxID=3376064 RepID=UPI00379DD729
MATIRFEGASALNLEDSGLVAFDSSFTRQNDFWRYETTVGDFVEVTGGGFKYDDGGRPVAGTVTDIAIDIGGDFGARNVIIGGLNVAASELDNSPQKFWDLVLGGKDVINVQGLDTSKVGQNSSLVFGDDIQAAVSTSATVITDRGDNDVFITGDGSYTLIGDVAFVGGGTRQEFIPAQPGTGTTPPVSGGLVTVTEFARYDAGNDLITGVSTDERQQFIGDAREVGGRGTLLGGDDKVSIASITGDSIAVGDAFRAGGDAADAKARVEGGNDTITGLDPVRVDGSRAILAGDVAFVSDFADVIGGNDTIEGSDEGELITGDVVQDISEAGSRIEGGDDIINGDGGNDEIAGDLFASVASNLASQSLTTTEGFAIAATGAATVVGGNDTIHGGDGDDTIFGELASNSAADLARVSGGNDKLFGDNGNDIIFGQSGNDLVDGGSGDDDMAGGTGDDIFIVDSVRDEVIEKDNEGTADRVKATVDYALDAGTRIEILTTILSTQTVDIDLTGNTLAQEIAGNAGANVLHDGGKGAADILRGFGGDDTYRVFNTGDTIVETFSQGASDRVIAAVDYTLGKGVYGEHLTTNGSSGTSSIDLTGNEIGQQIAGNAGVNIIDGKGGADELRGGSGKDFFVFSTALGAGNVDTIVDYSIAADTVRLENAVFTALAATGVLNAAAFRVNTTGLADDATDRIIFESDTGKLFYDADGTGVTAGVHFATLGAGLALTNADFVVI